MDSVLNSIIDTLNNSFLNELIVENRYVFPIMEMAHFLGLCLLFGSLLIVDLRIIGIAKSVPLKRVDLFIRFALIGFVINLITGLLFIVADPDRYLVNAAFWVKLGAITLAGLNTIFFVRFFRPQLHGDTIAADVSLGTKVVALLSLILWTCVIILGRSIPYVENL